jgi:hypothetical protein
MGQELTSLEAALEGRNLSDESIDIKSVFGEAVNDLMHRRFALEGDFSTVSKAEESESLAESRMLIFAVIGKRLGLDGAALARVKTVGQALQAHGIEPTLPAILGALAAKPEQN